MPGMPWRKSAATCPAADNAGKMREQSEIGVCLDKVVIPSGAKRSRGIYAFRYAFRLTWCEDPSTPLRFAQDDRLFFCLRLHLKSSFSQCLLKPITLIGVCRFSNTLRFCCRGGIHASRERGTFSPKRSKNRNNVPPGGMNASPTVKTKSVRKSTNTN